MEYEMILTDIESIRTELGFDDMGDINTAITQALTAAGPQIEGDLDTLFGFATYTDVFWVPEPGFVQGGFCSTKFLLRRGFVSNVRISVSTANDAYFIRETDKYGSGDTQVAPTIDTDRGIITDNVTRFSNQTVSVTYEAGFKPNSENKNLYDGVPQWLQEAAKLKAKQLLAASASLKQAGIDLDTGFLQGAYHSIMSQRLRYAPSAVLPQ